MAIRYPITLSTTEPNNDTGILKIRQADEKTQTLVVQITENGEPKSYEGLQVFFCAKLGQSLGLGIVEQKLNIEEMTAPKSGKFEYTFRQEDWQKIGRQTGYFSFRRMKDDHEYTEQFTTRDFYFTVSRSVFSDGVTEVKKDGSTYVWTIEDLIRLFNDYIASGKTDWQEFVDQNREILESVDPGGIILKELIDSRKPKGGIVYSNLSSRLDNQIGLNSEFRQYDDSSFMKRVFHDFKERSVNILWYGVKQDGSESCSSKIAQALKDLENSGGGELFFPAGKYLIDEPIILSSNINLSGSGSQSMIFHDKKNMNIVQTEPESENCEIKNLMLKGNSTGTQPENTIGSPNVTGAGCGIILVGAKNCIVKNCKIIDCGGEGIAGTEENGVAGIWLTFGCEQCVIEKNYIENCRNGINEDNYFGVDPFYNIIKMNRVVACRFGLVSDNTQSSRGFYFLDNTILRCKYSGIDVCKSGYGIIRNNYIAECGNTKTVDSSNNPIYARAINVYGSESGIFQVVGVIIEGNIIENNFGDGIGLVQNTIRCRASRNLIVKNNGHAINVQASRYYQISDNIIENNSGSGIYFKPMNVNSTEIAVDNGQIRGNTIQTSGQHGIYAKKMNGSIIDSNRIHNSSTSAANTFSNVYLENSIENVISGNVLSGENIKFCLSIVAGAVRNTISNNQSLAASTKKMEIQDLNQQYLSNNSDVRYAPALDMRSTNKPLILKAGAIGEDLGEIVVDLSASKLYVRTNSGVKSVALN